MMKSLLLALLLVCAHTTIAAESPIQVMVLGSYHMGNPGQDLHNLTADDVTVDQRQEQLVAVATVLAAFKPTVVAVEKTTEAPEFHDPAYQTFTPEQLRQDPNETIQLGYRIAHRLGLEVVYGIDEQPGDGEPDYFPFQALHEQSVATGQQERLGQMHQSVALMLKEFEQRQSDSSIAKLLIAANQELSDPSLYYEMLKLDQGEAQAASELNAYYFMRNAKIFSKLIDVSEPGDRVLVIYGAGHKHWLEHLAQHTPGFEVVDPVPYLKRLGD